MWPEVLSQVSYVFRTRWVSSVGLLGDFLGGTFSGLDAWHSVDGRGDLKPRIKTKGWCWKGVICDRWSVAAHIRETLMPLESQQENLGQSPHVLGNSHEVPTCARQKLASLCFARSLTTTSWLFAGYSSGCLTVCLLQFWRFWRLQGVQLMRKSQNVVQTLKQGHGAGREGCYTTPPRNLASWKMSWFTML